MLLTDIADLMIYMEALLAAARPASDPDSGTGSEPTSQSLLTPAMAELNAPPRSFRQVYGDIHNETGGLLSELGRTATDMTALLAELEQGLRDKRFDLPDGPRPAPRLGRYVYPVV